MCATQDKNKALHLCEGVYVRVCVSLGGWLMTERELIAYSFQSSLETLYNLRKKAETLLLLWGR